MPHEELHQQLARWQEDWRPDAERDVRETLLLEAVAGAQAFEASPEEVDAKIAEQIEIDARYAIYLARQEGDLRAFRRDEALKLPADLDYETIPSLSREVSQALSGARPATLGAAARLPGVTPAAVIALLRYVKRDPARPPPPPDAAA